MNKKPILLLTDKILPEENLKNFDKIITFDFDTHKLLLEKKIPHDISDVFLALNDFEAIQEKSYDFINWYNNDQVSEILKFNEINLGKLFFPEFHNMLVPFLKLFVELFKIFQKFKDENFVSTSKIHSILSTLTQHVTIFNTEHKISSKSSSIKYGFKIGSKHFSIELSKKNFKKFKNFSEPFFLSLISKNPDPFKKNILMIDFSPIRYKNFFLDIPKSKINVILHNRNSPYVWNSKSFSILKQSNCALTTNYGKFDKTSKNLLEKVSSDMSSKLTSLWNCNDFLTSFFSIYDVSFWPSLKKIFIPLFEKQVLKYIEEIEIVKRLFENYSFSSILIWSESGVNEQIAIYFAKKNNVKISLIQHGMYEDDIKSKKFNQLGILPSDSDKFLVWGEILKNYALDCGISENKIEIIGSPLYDEFFKKSKTKQTSSFILLATTNPQQNTISDLTFDSYNMREKVIENICKITSKLNKDLIIKLHPSPYEIDIENFVHNINPDINIVKSGNILELLKDCEVLIVINVSTTIIESQISEKPVISFHVNDRGFGKSQVFKSNSCLEVEISDFDDLLKKLSETVFRDKIIEKGKDFSLQYLSNQGTASLKLIEFLEKF